MPQHRAARSIQLLNRTLGKVAKARCWARRALRLGSLRRVCWLLCYVFNLDAVQDGFDVARADLLKEPAQALALSSLRLITSEAVQQPLSETAESSRRPGVHTTPGAAGVSDMHQRRCQTGDRVNDTSDGKRVSAARGIAARGIG